MQHVQFFADNAMDFVHGYIESLISLLETRILFHEKKKNTVQLKTNTKAIDRLYKE